MAYCVICNQLDGPHEVIGGVCALCRDPEVMQERISRLPEPMRGIFELTAESFGFYRRITGHEFGDDSELH